MMAKVELRIARFLLFVAIILQKTQASFYTAGVVEYHPVQNIPDALKTATRNAENYVKIIQKAADYTVDIIVFPENGVSSKSGNHTELLSAATSIPNPEDSVIPCNSTSDYVSYFRILSCAARENRLYVVINIHEKAECSESEDCDLKMYNTNVAFDRSGTVVARYRKYNLFGSESKEDGISRTPKPELSIFTTDFNVTFGQFICFDIMYQSPALTLVKEKNITDIVYSTRWFSELPFLTALQYQFGFSFANDVNFLGSGFNFPSASSRGSGIFAETKILNKFWSDDPSNVLLVANVPKVLENGKRDSSVKANPRIYKFDNNEIPTIFESSKAVFWYDNFTKYTTEIYKADITARYNKALCNRGLCCTFDISSTFTSENRDNFYTYRFVVFKGIRSYGYVSAGIEVCGVISCLDETLESCGHVPAKSLPSLTIFTSIDISRSVEKGFEDSKFYIPSVLKSDTNLLDSTEFSFTIDKTLNKASLSLKKAQQNLMAFAIYGRDYKNDNAVK